MGRTRALSLGTPLPPLDAHAISVSLPTWESNVGCQEAVPAVVDRMITGYPRFFIHRKIAEITAIFLSKSGTDDQKCLLFPSTKYADECETFMLAQSLKFSMTPHVRQIQFTIRAGEDAAAPAFDVHAVFFPSSTFRIAKQFWQHTGFGISSRFAQRCLELLEGPAHLSSVPKQRQGPVEDNTQYLTQSSLPSSDGVLCSVEKCHTADEVVSSATSAKLTLRNRIADLLARPSPSTGLGLNRLHDVCEDDVFLYPTGMTAIWYAHQLVVTMRPVAKFVCFGFPYIDTLKILEKWGPGCYFFGRDPDSDMEELEVLLASSPHDPPIAALFCEFPSNPRLLSPRLGQLRALADKYDFLIVADDTVGNFANVDVLPYVDIVTTSLSKFFSGYANALGGSIVLNSCMRHYKALKVAQTNAFEDTYFDEDAIIMELNSRDFAPRMRTINANADILCEFLRSRSLLASPEDKSLIIKEIFYPKWTTRDEYDLCRLKIYAGGEPAHDNFGGLFSLTFVSDLASHTFHDALSCAKGPSLGTNFTLVCPYTILAHYAEREWAAEYGVEEGLVRVSVGLEEHEEILADFDFALRKAEEALDAQIVLSMSQLSVDRAYTNLLTHLQQPRSGLPLQTIVSAVPHYLSQLPLPHPTQLTAFVISSPLWQPLSVNSVRSLTTAFRSAVHLKYSNLQKDAGRWFSRGPEALLREWISAVMKGVSRGDVQLRIGILGGLLLGLEDLRNKELRYGFRARVEEQVVIACAEVLEAISIMDGVWNNEFTVKRVGKDQDESATLFLYSASQILPLVASDRLSALDLPALVQLTRKGIQSAFLSGEFLSDLSTSVTREHNGQITISPESRLVGSLQNISKHPLYDVIGPLAKLLSRCLSRLGEVAPMAVWSAFHDTSQVLESMAFKVETHWKGSLLAGAPSEQDIETRTRELLTEIWKVLKTLLFAHLLVSQSILSSISYLSPARNTTPSEPNSSSVSRSILRSLHHLSFVLSQFGGVTSTAEGFKELKRVFYMALDIFAADPDPQTSNIFVEELVSGARASQMDSGHPFQQSKTAYVLAVIEQLMPLLNESIIETVVMPFCDPYLNGPLHRETYESAHSVVLSVFAAHAQKGEGNIGVAKPTLARRLVPFYVDSLIKNSTEGRLSTSQLKLAYSSLVRSAASSGDDALAWLCVEALLARIEASATNPSSRRPMDLYVTLISLISCVPLSLLPRELEEVQKALEVVDGEDTAKLAKAVLEEITNRVGDREREAALSWWSELAPSITTLEDAAE